MEEAIVISCWFGEGYHKPKQIKSWKDIVSLIKYVLKTNLPTNLASYLGIQSVIPKNPNNNIRSLFFTNNKSLKNEIIQKGWEYVFIDKKMDNGASQSSSLQAKEVKFLQFDDKFMSILLDYKYIIYMDSKIVTNKISQLISLTKKGLLIRYTPKLKTTVWDEVNAAKNQERYAKAMNETIEFVNDKISNGYSPENRVMATGLIVYKTDDILVRKLILELCKEVYDACITLHQPECQIFWCLLSQKYDDIITKVEFDIILNEKTYKSVKNK